MKVVLSPSNPDFPVEILMPRGFSTKLCKVVLPVSLVVLNALCGVGEHCETVHEFFVRVLHSTGVLRISHANVKVALGSQSPFILFLVAVTVLCYKLHLDKLQCIIQSFLIVRSVVPSDVSLVGLMIVLVDDDALM